MLNVKQMLTEGITKENTGQKDNSISLWIIVNVIIPNYMWTHFLFTLSSLLIFSVFGVRGAKNACFCGREK